jgi:hypothetical protein
VSKGSADDDGDEEEDRGAEAVAVGSVDAVVFDSDDDG